MPALMIMYHFHVAADHEVEGTWSIGRCRRWCSSGCLALAALRTLPPPSISLYGIVGASTTHQPQKSGCARMAQVVVCISHFAPYFRRNVADYDPRDVSFSSCEIVPVVVQVAQNFLPWDHLDVLTNLSWLRNELRRLILFMMGIVISWKYLLILFTGMFWSWKLFAFFTLRGIVVGVVQLHRNFLHVHWFMMMVLWVRSLLRLVVVVIVVLLVRHR